MELAIVAACVVLSALFSGTEVAMFALRRVDREQLSRSNRPADKRVLTLLNQPRRLITTVLIVNESINSVITVLVLGLVITYVDLAPWAQLVVATAIMVFVLVLLGEVTPKAFALKSPLTWARVAGGPLRLVHGLVAPVRWVVGGLVELMLRPLGGVRSAPQRDLSEEEFRTLIDASSAQGQVDARERRLIHKVFEFSDKNVGQIMTPRDRVFALSYDLPTARLLKEVAARGFSRVPIYQKSLDNVRGILNAKDLLRPQGQGRTLGELLYEPLFVPRTTPIKRVFLTFKQKKVHMAIVVNEYGKVLGLVTMDDVLAQLFGTLRDEREGLQARRGRADRPTHGGAPTRAGAELASGDPAAPERAPLGPSAADEHDPEPRPFGRKSGRVEVHDEVTPPAVDLAELLTTTGAADAASGGRLPEAADLLLAEAEADERVARAPQPDSEAGDLPDAADSSGSSGDAEP